MSTPTNKHIMQAIETVRKSFTQSREFNKQLRTILTVELHNAAAMNFIYEETSEILITESKKRELVNNILREHVLKILDETLGKYK